MGISTENGTCPTHKLAGVFDPEVPVLKLADFDETNGVTVELAFDQLDFICPAVELSEGKSRHPVTLPLQIVGIIHPADGRVKLRRPFSRDICSRESAPGKGRGGEKKRQSFDRFSCAPPFRLDS